MKYILAFETSCDDTCVAIFDIQKNIFYSEKYDHSKMQSKFSGILPQLSTELHHKKVIVLLNRILKKTDIKLEQISFIAYTFEPGLFSSLFLGKIVAETIAFTLNKALIKINHLEAHAYSSLINLDVKPQYPSLALILSGGHTCVLLIKSISEFQMLGNTKDDAIGEVLDKVGRKLGLPYPAGPEIEKLANAVDSSKIKEYKIATHKPTGLSGSFSGIKADCLRIIQKNKAINKEAFCLELQKSVFTQVMTIVDNTFKIYPDIQSVLVGGGVSANHLLKQSLELHVKIHYPNKKVYFPLKKYATDNAVMIAYTAFLKLNNI